MSADVMMRSSDELNTPASEMEVEETPWYVTDLYMIDKEDKVGPAISKLKNLVIGSNRQKSQALSLGILPQVLNLLGDPSIVIEIRRDACVTLGSLVKGTPDNVRAVVTANSVPKLISVLESSDEKLITCSLSCLTTIFSHDFAPTEVLYSTQGLIPHLLILMNESPANQVSVATILSHSCKSQEQQEILAQNGVVAHLAALLCSPSIKVQMPAVSCLTSMAYKNEHVSNIIATTVYNDKLVPDLLTTLIARDKPVKMQLSAARCFTYLHRANALSSTDHRIMMKTLPALVRICSKENCQEFRILSAETLAYLIEVDKDLQGIAAISNHLIPTLADYIKTPPVLYKPLFESGSSGSMIQAAFRAFASLAANDEPIRKRIIETEHLMERVVTGLEDSNEQVALASVLCLHSLSRSVHLLRTTFKDHTVWKPLMKLLQHSNQEILNVASSTLCNLILEFSPAKEHMLDAGAVDILCDLTRHEEMGLRLNGIWALMNVAFQADQKVKTQILNTLGTDQIFRLLSDCEANIIMKTLGLLRNLISAPHIDHLMGIYGKQVMQATILILEGDHDADVKEQALCLLANVSTGVSAKEFIMTNEDILKKIANYLIHGNSKLQIAAVQCVTFLACRAEGYIERQAKLKEIGIFKHMHTLITTNDQPLYERVKEALNLFQGSYQGSGEGKFSN